MLLENVILAWEQFLERVLNKHSCINHSTCAGAKPLSPCGNYTVIFYQKKVVLNFFYHFGVGLKILGLKSSFINWTVKFRTEKSWTEKFIFPLDCKDWD